MPRTRRRRRSNRTRTSTGLASTSKMPVAGVFELMRRDLFPVTSGLLVDIEPDDIQRIFRSANRYISDQVQLAHEIEQYDDHIRGTLSLRRKAVLRMEYKVESGKPGDPQSDLAAQAAESVLDSPWFRNASEWLLGAVLKQWAAVELIWETKKVELADTMGNPTARPMRVVKTIREVEPWRWHFEVDEAGVRPVLFTGVTKGTTQVAEVVAGKFMVHSWDANSTPGDFGMIRSVAKLWYMNYIATNDWARMIEMFGLPTPIFEYLPGSSEAAVQATVDNLWALARQKVIAVPQGTNLRTEPIPKATPHHEWRLFYEKAMSRLLLGQTKSQIATEAASTGATLQGEVRDDVRDDDAEALDASQAETFWRPWTDWNFGEGVAAPIITRVTATRADPEQRGRVFESAQRLGLKLVADEIYGDLGITRPTGDDGEQLVPDVIEPPEQLPPAAPAFNFRRDMIVGGGKQEARIATAVGQAAQRAAELTVENVELVRAVAETIDTQGGTEREKFTRLMERLAGLHEEFDVDERAEMLHLAQFGALGKGAINAETMMTGAN